MVKFGEYFESMVALKPEWRKAFVDYPRMNKLLAEVKAHVHIEVQLKDGGAVQVTGAKAFQELAEKGVVARVGDGVNTGRAEFVIMVDEQKKDGGVGAGKPGFKRVQQLDIGHLSPSIDTDSVDDLFQRRKAREEAHAQLHGEKTALLRGSAGFEPLSPGFPRVSLDGALPPEVVPDDASVDSAGSMIHGVVPKITNVGVAAAKEFEEVLLKEVQKTTAFARQSLDTYFDYFESNRTLWTEKLNGASRPRAKESMRYLYAEVTHLRDFVDTNELAVRKALKKYLHAHPFFIRDAISEATLLPQLHEVRVEASTLRDALRATWAEAFGDDVTAAKQNILSVGASRSQAFRAGALVACIAATLAYWLHVFLELGLDDEAATRFERVFPVCRLFILLSFAYTCWGFTLYCCTHHRINYLYLLGLSPKASMTWLQCTEYGLLMFWLAVLAPVLYARSIHHRAPTCYASSGGFPGAAPYFIPVCGAAFLGTLAFPYRHVFRRSRAAFFKSFWRCVKQPFGGAPMFQDFLVADIGTSFACFAQDLVYGVCYYTATPLEAGHFGSASWGACAAVRQRYGIILAMLPYFWRACHTFKMYRKTGQRAHVVNHGKYLTLLLYMALDCTHANAPGAALSDLVWAVHVAAQVYSYAWDISMDWGWIRGAQRGSMMKSMGTHYCAIAFDLAARALFIPGVLWAKGAMGDAAYTTVAALIEIGRRAVWCVFRFENENLNNLEKYRTVDFVPHAVLCVD